MYKEKIVNVETGEMTWRDYTPEEIAEVEKAQELAQIEIAAANKAAEAKKAVLEKLGLTEEEAKVLLG